MKYKTLLEWDSIGQPSSQGALVFNQFLSMLLFFELLKTALIQLHHHLTYQSSTWKRFQSTPLLASLAIPFCLIPFVRLTALRAQCDSPPTCSHLHISLHSWAAEHVYTRLGLAGSQRWTTGLRWTIGYLSDIESQHLASASKCEHGRPLTKGSPCFVIHISVNLMRSYANFCTNCLSNTFTQ